MELKDITTKTFEQKVRDVFDTIDIVYGSQEDAIQLILEANAEELRKVKEEVKSTQDKWEYNNSPIRPGSEYSRGKFHGYRESVEDLNAIIDKKIGGDNED